MRVCLIVEGAYPYVNGGMSSWIQQLMLSMPDVEFIVQSIAATRDDIKEFKYKIPDNVLEIQEVYLMDDDYVSHAVQNRIKMTRQEYQAFETLLFGEKADWDSIIKFFLERPVSLNALLSGEDFLKMVLAYYKEHFERVVFTDFLWTMRSMYLPLFTMLKSRTAKADLYHTASSGYAAVWGSMQRYLYQKPFILSEHGIYTREREEEIIRADWVRGIYKDLWIQQFRKIGICGYQYADKVTSLFEDARQFQIELGCDPKKTVVIPNGVDPKQYDGCPEKTPDDPFINVGAILRVTPIKDVKTMLSAFSLAKQTDHRLKLWIMGSLEEAPEYAEECRQLVADLHIPDVVFTGIVNVKDYIGKMDMLVLSSLSEGQPLAILEGFAAKKPFIATNVGNCRGLIEGEFDDWGRAGYIVPIMSASQMARAMVKMAGNAPKRRKMGDIGYQRVRAFYDQSDIYQRYYQLYRQMTGTNEE
ncbi:GT4 family glycosyltransferase PelF [Massiliimalia massiliensis]|uniref:GT4 family glycosyltransferase PelF n=1 Tax=Massiliimalia massiliensis TaxID=1852384 RepID=UPI0009842DE9|nr:GT4 family glycosyltransferase PelF [Massiliimalia massiliensis]